MKRTLVTVFATAAVIFGGAAGLAVLEHQPKPRTPAQNTYLINACIENGGQLSGCWERYIGRDFRTGKPLVK